MQIFQPTKWPALYGHLHRQHVSREWHGFSSPCGLKSQVGMGWDFRTLGLPIPPAGVGGFGWKFKLWWNKHISTQFMTCHHHSLLTTPTTIDDWPRGTTTIIKEWWWLPTNVHGCPAPPLMHGNDSPPQPLTIGHKDPPLWWSTSTHKQLQGPTPWSMADDATMTDERPRGPFNTNNKGLTPQSMNGYRWTHRDQQPTMSDVHGAHHHDQWMATRALHH